MIRRLQCFINLETISLDLLETPSLKSDVLSPGETGNYSHITNIISISNERLSRTGKECLMTILHECHHSYQSYLCESITGVDEKYLSLEMFRDIKEYEANFSDYQEHGEDYSKQSVEISAYVHSRITADEYLKRIEELQEEGDKYYT